MRKLLKLLKHSLFGIAALIALVFFWPPGPNFSEMGTEREVTLKHKQDSFVVGVSWPIQLHGPSLVNGMKLAISHIGETGLIDNMPIELVVRDDKGQVTIAQDVARDFSDNKHMSAVVGFKNDHQAAAAAVIYQTSKLLQVVVGAPSTGLTRRNQPYLVRTSPSTTELVTKLARRTGKSPIRFAGITEQSGSYVEFAGEFAIAQMHKGGKRVYNHIFPIELMHDFVKTSYEIRALNPDYILFSGRAEQAAIFAKQAKRIGLSAPILCSCTDFEILHRTLGATQQDIIIPAFYEMTSDSDENKHFVAGYKKQFGIAPDEWAAQGYDAMLILAHAVAESGSVEPLDLSWSIRYMAPVMGASGKLYFSKDGYLIDKDI